MEKKAQQFQLHKQFLRELCSLPGYNYNYKNYSSANNLRNDFVEHGNYFTGLGRLGNIYRNSGVATESER